MSEATDYLDGFACGAEEALGRVRAIVSATIPEAEEGRSYSGPAFIYCGHPLLGFRAAQKHLSLFPFSPAVVQAVKDRLAGFDVSKRTIRFTSKRPLPPDVITEIVRSRHRELD